MKKQILWFAGAFITLLCACMVMIISAYSIKLDSIRDNVRESAILLQQEGDYPNVWNQFYMKKDNFTDNIMYNIAVPSGDYSTIDGAMLNPVSGVDSDGNECAAATIRITEGYDVQSTERWHYGRYWHGYQLPLRIMSLFMPLKQIRIVNNVLLWGLLLLTGGLIWRKIGIRYAIGYVLSILAVGFPAVPMSLQFTTCFYIMFLGVLAVLCIPAVVKSRIASGILFMVIGGLTSFFDFLTTPVLTLCMPLLIMMLLSGIRNPGFIVRQCLLWGIGYGGIWASKWILGSLITGENIISDAYSVAQWRSVCSVFTESGFNAISHIVLLGTILFVIIPGVLTILYLHYYKRRLREGSYLYIIALMPIMWYLLLFNHSFIHIWFTYRSLAVYLFCMYLIMFNKAKSRV